MWFGWLPELAGVFRVIRPDARGHGRSQAPPPDYIWRLDDLVSDVVALLDGLGIARVHYVGESLGGIVGIAFAASHPERVRSLTLCATPTAIREGPARLRALEYPDWASAIAALGVRGWYLAYRARTNDLHPEDPGRDDWFAGQAALSPPHAIAALTALTVGLDVTDLAPRVTCPTLVLSPARSPLSASPEQQRALAAAISGARQDVIDGPGHHIYLDRPAECARATRSFIQSL
jgi:pimeloyl-ACP methyl ester carboxylesterase